MTGWLVKNLTFFTQEDAISFPAVVSQRTPLPRRGEEPLLQCGGRGLQAPCRELGCPGGLGGWFRATLKSALKIRDWDAALFLSQGSALPSISPKMCGFTSVPTTNTLLNFRQSLSFFFVGMWTLLQGSVFCVMFFLLFFFWFVSIFFFLSVWSAPFRGRSWLLHGIRACEKIS